jgi:hypothetical protein
MMMPSTSGRPFFGGPDARNQTIKVAAFPRRNSKIMHAQNDLLALPQSEYLTVESMVPAMRESGYKFLTGLTGWFDDLTPFNRTDAWEALHDSRLGKIIDTNPDQKFRFFINDEGKLPDRPSASVTFETKSRKSHLTIVEGAEWAAQDAILPNTVRNYFADCLRFLGQVRDDLNALLPAMSLPTILKLRIFSYNSSERSDLAMRPHVDGSVCSIIIARSDGLLHFRREGKWTPACRLNQRPFAIAIPGLAAEHDLHLPPTPHLVMPSSAPRTSVTVFLTPDLPGNQASAEAALAQWNLRHLDSLKYP